MRAQLLVCFAIILAADGVPVLTTTNQPPIPKVDPNDFAIVVTEAGTDSPKYYPTTTTALNEQPSTPNPFNVTYPPVPAAMYYLKPQEYTVAAAPQVDPALKSIDGIEPPPIVFGQAQPNKNPMEIKTPLIDPRPCYEGMDLVVEVLSAERVPGDKFATLPSRYGCSDARDISREKASPAIRVSNFTAGQVRDFSLEMISMGEGTTCQGPGSPNFNTIYWHAVNIHPQLGEFDHNFTIPEGASKDKRVFYGAQELPNQWLEEYYGGPCPVPGTSECFRFKVLAHLWDGSNCICGYEDVLFTRPQEKPQPQAWSYDASAVIDRRRQ